MSANPKTKSLRWYLLGALVVVATVTTVVLVIRPCILFDTKTTVLIVRHAEKERGEDSVANPDGTFGPALCDPFGLARARELAHVAGVAGVRAIYHTQFLRTRQTIEPLDNLITGNTTQMFEADNVEGLVNDILTNRRGQTILIASHTSRIPQIIERLDGPRPPDIDENDFDNFYVVTVSCFCGPQVVQLQYGKESPLSPTEAEECQ